MQGMPKTSAMSLVMFPLLAACTSQQPVEVDDRFQLLQETPRSSSQRSLVEIPKVDNCAVGCPSGGGEVTIFRDVYTLNNNGSTKFANWVAYKITKDTPAPNRPRNWKTDPDISPSETLNPVDYNGAYVASALDRGHQANLASMGGVKDWQPLNYMSNITPQKENLNRGAWARLENQERRLGKTPGIEAVYVATGPLYERKMDPLPGTNKVHTIPSGYWKVIFLGSTPADGMYAAFIMEQSTPLNADFCEFQVTVADIERRSGLTLWGNLPDDIQARLKSTPGNLPSKIGCVPNFLRPVAFPPDRSSDY